MIQQQDLIAVLARQIQIVRDQYDGQPSLPIQPLNDTSNIQLMMEIQKCRGFIQQQDLRFLHQRPGNHRPLSFPTRHFGHQAISEMCNIKLFHGVLCHRPILGIFPMPSSPTLMMRRPAHQHHLGDGKGKHLKRFLRHERHALGHVQLGKAR